MFSVKYVCVFQCLVPRACTAVLSIGLLGREVQSDWIETLNLIEHLNWTVISRSEKQDRIKKKKHKQQWSSQGFQKSDFLAVLGRRNKWENSFVFMQGMQLIVHSIDWHFVCLNSKSIKPGKRCFITWEDEPSIIQKSNRNTILQVGELTQPLPQMYEDLYSAFSTCLKSKAWWYMPCNPRTEEVTKLGTELGWSSHPIQWLHVVSTFFIAVFHERYP